MKYQQFLIFNEYYFLTTYQLNSLNKMSLSFHRVLSLLELIRVLEGIYTLLSVVSPIVPKTSYSEFFRLGFLMNKVYGSKYMRIAFINMKDTIKAKPKISAIYNY